MRANSLEAVYVLLVVLRPCIFSIVFFLRLCTFSIAFWAVRLLLAASPLCGSQVRVSQTGVACMVQTRVYLCVELSRLSFLLLAGFHVCVSLTWVACVVQTRVYFCVGLSRFRRLLLAWSHLHVSLSGVACVARTGVWRVLLAGFRVCASQVDMCSLVALPTFLFLLCPLPCLLPCLCRSWEGYACGSLLFLPPIGTGRLPFGRLSSS